ncbi:uncharacterized protein LOC105833724 isoform X2 [Monomorium pharaonis]|uniref:uncharacterized protein LOC105833724 isoform X2 n=1 Tax=Monomorium pharaonis TaxID=307658 RepID=UPI00174759E4|nr:uncharacterized protein LOC105833724 isoform X2 [Monomorium pharaonis]
MKKAAIEKAAKKLLANVYKEKKKHEISDELYFGNQGNKWIKESVRPVLKKQCDITNMARQKAERKARDEAVDTAFARYLAEERKKELEKQREYNNTRHAKKIQYGQDLKEIITNNRIIYAMNILERQSEICTHDKKTNQLTATSAKQFNNRNDNKI